VQHSGEKVIALEQALMFIAQYPISSIEAFTRADIRSINRTVANLNQYHIAGHKAFPVFDILYFS